MDLFSHKKGYSLNNLERVGMCLCAFPYAMRHYKEAGRSDQSTFTRWGHRVIGALEFFPGIGTLVGIIEWVVTRLLYKLGWIHKKCHHEAVFNPLLECKIVSLTEKPPKPGVQKSALIKNQLLIHKVISCISLTIGLGVFSMLRFKLTR